MSLSGRLARFGAKAGQGSTFRAAGQIITASLPLQPLNTTNARTYPASTCEPTSKSAELCETREAHSCHRRQKSSCSHVGLENKKGIGESQVLTVNSWHEDGEQARSVGETQRQACHNQKRPLEDALPDEPLQKKRKLQDVEKIFNPSACCPVCGTALGLMDAPAQLYHINKCLDEPQIPNKQAASGVECWLRNLGLAKHAARFNQEKIEMSVLPFLTLTDLEALGVATVHERAAISGAALQIARLVPSLAPASGSEGAGERGERSQTPAIADVNGAVGNVHCSRGSVSCRGVGLGAGRPSTTTTTQYLQPVSAHIDAVCQRDSPCSRGIEASALSISASRGVAGGEKGLTVLNNSIGFAGQAPSRVSEGGRKHCIPSAEPESKTQRMQLSSHAPSLKPPAATSVPGRSKSKHGAKSAIALSDSTYSRQLESTLLVALCGREFCYSVNEGERYRDYFRPALSEIESSSTARLVDPAASLWTYTSCQPGVVVDLGTKPLADRIREARLKTRAAVAAKYGAQATSARPGLPNGEHRVQQTAAASTITADVGTESRRSGRVVGKECCKVGDSDGSAARAMQLEALRSELVAAEDVVRELKRLISDLETS